MSRMDDPITRKEVQDYLELTEIDRSRGLQKSFTEEIARTLDGAMTVLQRMSKQHFDTCDIFKSYKFQCSCGNDKASTLCDQYFGKVGT